MSSNTYTPDDDEYDMHPGYGPVNTTSGSSSSYHVPDPVPPQNTATIPKIMIQRDSHHATEHDTLTDLRNSYSSLRVSKDEHSKWICCQCKAEHKLFKLQDEHPLGVLLCTCTHLPCESCKMEGLVKRYEPMYEPAFIPLCGEPEKRVMFGVVCSACGLTWRAKELGRSEKKMRKVPSLGVVKGAQHMLRKSKSSVTVAPFGQSQQQQQQEGVEQAAFARVIFTGIYCTSCQSTSTSSSYCFQIVDPPKDFYQAQLEERMASRPKGPGWSTTPELQARGHGTPVLKTSRGRRPNPLMSNPVTTEDVEMVAQIRKELRK